MGSESNADDIVCGANTAKSAQRVQKRTAANQHNVPTPTMAAPHQRKVELQSPADFTYLYANTIALSRQKLDQALPPSATSNDDPDPLRERVRELVDEVCSQRDPCRAT